MVVVAVLVVADGSRLCDIVDILVAEQTGRRGYMLSDLLVVVRLALPTEEGGKVDGDHSPFVFLPLPFHAHQKGKERGSRWVHEEPACEGIHRRAVYLLLDEALPAIMGEPGGGGGGDRNVTSTGSTPISWQPSFTLPVE